MKLYTTTRFIRVGEKTISACPCLRPTPKLLTQTSCWLGDLRTPGGPWKPLRALLEGPEGALGEARRALEGGARRLCVTPWPGRRWRPWKGPARPSWRAMEGVTVLSPFELWTGRSPPENKGVGVCAWPDRPEQVATITRNLIIHQTKVYTDQSLYTKNFQAQRPVLTRRVLGEIDSSTTANTPRKPQTTHHHWAYKGRRKTVNL